MPAWLAWLSADPVTSATDSLIAQGTGWAAAVVVSAVVVGLWRRDVRRSDEALAAAAAEMVAMRARHAEALAFERARAAAAEKRAEDANDEKSDLEKEIRDRFVPVLTELARDLPIITELVRYPRRDT